MLRNPRPAASRRDEAVEERGRRYLPTHLGSGRCAWRGRFFRGGVVLLAFGVGVLGVTSLIGQIPLVTEVSAGVPKVSALGLSQLLDETTAPPTYFVQYYDWWSHGYHQKKGQTAQKAERGFVDRFEWASMGLPPDSDDRQSEQFHQAVFKRIRSLGIDSISWQIDPSNKGNLSGAAVQGLRASGLKAAPFFDAEFVMKHEHHERMDATFSTFPVISPDQNTIDIFVAYLKPFWGALPPDMRGRDSNGNLVVFVFANSYSKEGQPGDWSSFANRLVNALAGLTDGEAPSLYLSYHPSSLAEHLFLHHRDNFKPFQFVSDAAQGQYGHDAVTWNFGFDNYAVQKRDRLRRVVRVDPRYVQEQSWLAAAADPSLVFIYSWNEPFESSMLMPTQQWGDVKGRLVKHYIANRTAEARVHRLPKTLIIVSDLSRLYQAEEAGLWARLTFGLYQGKKRGQWTTLASMRLSIQRQLLRYPLRRFAPQADLRVEDEVTSALLDKYEVIVCLVHKNLTLSSLLSARIGSHRIMSFGPQFASMRGHFVRDASDYRKAKLPQFVPPLQGLVRGGHMGMHAASSLPGDSRREQLYARDIIDTVICAECKEWAHVEMEDGSRIPLIVTRRNDVWVNANSMSWLTLTVAFEALYGNGVPRSWNASSSILYGESDFYFHANSEQRLEVSNRGAYFFNRLERPSVNRHLPIPDWASWRRPLRGLPGTPTARKRAEEFAYSGGGSVEFSSGRYSPSGLFDPPTLLLHVGPWKTGTTAFQTDLNTHHEYLRDRGVFWPQINDRPVPPKAIADYAFSLLGSRGANFSGIGDFKSRLESFVQTAPGHVVLSSECFSNLKEAARRQIAALAKGYKVVVVMSYRNAVSLILSDYSQKNSGSNDVDLFSTWYAKQDFTKDTGVDIVTQVEGYAAVFGRSNLRILDYDGAVASGVDMTNVILASAGLETKLLAETSESRRSNPSRAMPIRQLWAVFVKYVATEHRCAVQCLPQFDLEKSFLGTFQLPLACGNLPALSAFSIERDRQVREKYADLILYGNATASAVASREKLPYCELDVQSVRGDARWNERFSEQYRRLLAIDSKSKQVRIACS